MRSLIFNSIIFLSLSGLTLLKAQSPQKLSYQAVVRNASNALISNANVTAKISILQGSFTGTPVYEETQATTTNVNGLMTFQIGSGTIISGNIGSIDWANGPYFLKTETDPSGGNNYNIIATSELLSVPYALYAANSGSTDCSACDSHFINSSTSDVMTGTLTVNNIKYSPAISHTVLIGETEFFSRDGVASVGKGFGNGGAYISNSNSAGMIGSVQIPPGSTVTAVTFYFYDSDATNDIQFNAYRYYLSTGGYFAVGSETTNISSGYGNMPLMSGLPFTVNNTGLLEFVIIAKNGSTTIAWPGISLIVRGVEVVYLRDKP